MSFTRDKDDSFHHRKYKNRDTSSDSETGSNTNGNSRRRYSSSTDGEDRGNSTPEVGKSRYEKGTSRSKKSYEDDRHQKQEKSRHVSSSSSSRDSIRRDCHKRRRKRDKRSHRDRSSSSSNDSDGYNRRRKRTRSKSRSRSRSREPKHKEREPKRNSSSNSNTETTQKAGDRRLFPHASDDRSNIALESINSQNEGGTWREGGPLPPPVFVGNQSTGIAPPPPNISGRVAPQPMVQKGHKLANAIKLSVTSPSAHEDSHRSSFVPPSYLKMPMPPNSNVLTSGREKVIPPPLGGRPIPPPPVRLPSAPALGNRPPPPPIRPIASVLSSSHTSSHSVTNEAIVNFHDSPKAPKKLPETKPEMKQPPPKVLSGPTKNIAIKLGAVPKVKSAGLNNKRPTAVASVFGADDSDSDEEMPLEAKMRMRNVGRETITSSGPNSFGKTRQGFTDTKKLYEKNMHKPLFDEN